MSEKVSKVIENAANFYILPMLQLNKSSFGTNNFINCYLDKSGYIIINTWKEVSDSKLLEHSNYITDYNKDEWSVNYVFSIPEEHKQDILLFMAGKYSELSAKLKVAISKLPNISSAVLKTLNPTKEDRQRLADELHVSIDLIKEIKSAPSEVNYVSIK